MEELIKSLTATYRDDNYIFCGPKIHEFQLKSEVMVKIEQGVTRTINICAEKATVRELYAILTKLERLLVLFDGRFYNLEKLQLVSDDESRAFYLERLSFDIQRLRLKYYKSDNLYKQSIIRLIDFEDVLTADLYYTWCELLEELDIANQMYLYASSDCGLTTDVKCAFLIELAESLIEILKLKKSIVVPQENKKGDPTLADCLRYLIKNYGKDIFAKEIDADIDKFIKVSKDSRVKIMHIKRFYEKKLTFNGKESALYAMKFSLLYRKIMFEFMEIPESIYSIKLERIINTYDNWDDVLDRFLEKMLF